MAKTRLRIGLQLEESIVPGSIIRTDVANEQEYIAPGAEQQVLTIVAGVPTWASDPVLPAATDCVVDTAKITIDEAGTKKTATIRQIANSTKSATGSGLAVTDQTQIFSTGGTVTLPNALCQEVTVSTTPCDAGQTTVSAIKIDDETTLVIPQDGYRSYSFMWDGTGYRVTKSYFKPALASVVIPVTNATTQNIRLNQQNSNIYSINWGDGNNTLNIADNVGASHTYLTSFTGNITITSSCSISPKQLYFTPSSFVSGNISTLPSGLTLYSNEGLNTTTGNIGNLPISLTYFNNTGNNTTSGDISDLPTKLDLYQNTGNNTTTGNIANLPTELTYYVNTGNNTTSGNIANLPSGLTYFQNTGNNTTTGNIGSLPVGLTEYQNYGSNTTSGDISNLPVGLISYKNEGSNTTTGNISNLPTGLTSYSNLGSNTTSGDVSNLPAGLTYYNNEGLNTTSGDIGNLPVGLTLYQNFGNNTTSGNIATLPTTLTYYASAGNNTTTGDVSNLPTGLTYYQNTGTNQVNNYTAGRAWASNMIRFVQLPAAGFGLTSVMVDNLLIDLAATTWSPGSILNLSGNNAARTATSNASVLTLQGLGVTVITN